MKFIAIVTVYIVYFCAFAHAQTAVWSKLQKEDLLQQQVSHDTTANAVVLFSRIGSTYTSDYRKLEI